MACIVFEMSSSFLTQFLSFNVLFFFLTAFNFSLSLVFWSLIMVYVCMVYEDGMCVFMFFLLRYLGLTDLLVSVHLQFSSNLESFCSECLQSLFLSTFLIFQGFSYMCVRPIDIVPQLTDVLLIFCIFSMFILDHAASPSSLIFLMNHLICYEIKCIFHSR